MPPPDAITILHVEDSENDAILIESAVRAAWPRSTFRRVAGEKEYIGALDNAGIDLILSDYSMPGFDGLTALEIARTRAPAIPFIFLSGTIGEERAVEALKRGATDYLIKDRPARLVPAIRHALERCAEIDEKNRIEKTARQRLQELENQEALAARVAHDLNNIFTPIVMAASILGDKLTDLEDRQLLDAIQSSARLGSSFVSQLFLSRASDGELTAWPPLPPDGAAPPVAPR